MSVPLRDKTADLRRRHIVEAATGVFAEYGFERATIRRISQAAGVSDGTIYNVFENKTALLMAALDPLYEADAMPPPPPDTAVGIEGLLRAMLHARWRHLTTETLDPMKIVLSEALTTPEVRAVFVTRVIEPALRLPEPIFAAMMHRGEIRPGDPARPPQAIVAMVLGYVLLRLLGDPRVLAEWDEIPDRLADLLANGLGVSEAGANDVAG